MIRISVDVRCDKCGRVVHHEETPKWRISGLMTVACRDLRGIGWKFERDENWELKRVVCWNCNEEKDEGKQ